MDHSRDKVQKDSQKEKKNHVKDKKTGSGLLWTKFETLRREIKADIKKQHNLNVNNLVGDVKTNPRDFYRYISSRKKTGKEFPPLKKWEEMELQYQTLKGQRN